MQHTAGASGLHFERAKREEIPQYAETQAGQRLHCDSLAAGRGSSQPKELERTNGFVRKPDLQSEKTESRKIAVSKFRFTAADGGTS
jgi:hypothetical protein